MPIQTEFFTKTQNKCLFLLSDCTKILQIVPKKLRLCDESSL